MRRSFLNGGKGRTKGRGKEVCVCAYIIRTHIFTHACSYVYIYTCIYLRYVAKRPSRS
jgi:hypothetical protein